METPSPDSPCPDSPFLGVYFQRELLVSGRVGLLSHDEFGAFFHFKMVGSSFHADSLTDGCEGTNMTDVRGFSALSDIRYGSNWMSIG